jgi:hypothetical protein
MRILPTVLLAFTANTAAAQTAPQLRWEPAFSLVRGN